MDGDISSLLVLCWDAISFPRRGESSILEVDKVSLHPAHDIKDTEKYFPVVQNHCKQVLKQLNDTRLDFILLSCEVDDVNFNSITCLRVLATLAFKRGDTETLEKTPTVIRKWNDSRNASILLNDLGVMLSLKAVYQRSEECFLHCQRFF